MSNSILEDDGSDHWRMGKFEQSNSPQSPSTISSHSDLSHMSFRTEYSLRNGLSDSGPMISMRDRQENLNHSSMILKKCQEALAAKLSVRSRRHSASHTDMEQINYPKETIPEPSSLQFMPDHRRVPHYYTGRATPHMAPHSAHHPTYYPAPHTPQYSAPHTPQYSAPHSAQHSTLHTPQHSAPHAPQHPASSDRLEDVRRSSISEMPDSPASLPRLGEVMNPDGESPLLVSGIGSVRRAQHLLNNVPANREVVGAHRLVIVYSTRKHAYFAMLKGHNGKWKQGVRCKCATVDTLMRVTLIEPVE